MEYSPSYGARYARMTPTGAWTGYDASYNEPLDLLQNYKLYRRSLRNLNHESSLKSQYFEFYPFQKCLHGIKKK